MKKILLTLFIFSILIQGKSFATCDYSCTAPYDMNSKMRTVFGAISGVNSITEKAAENALKKAILKLGSAEKLEVNIDSFSSKDLKNGIFKSAQINAQNANVRGMYASALSLKTLCDFNYVKYLNNELIIVEDIPMSFDIKLTSQDINKTMKHAKYQKIINDLNKLGNTYGYGLKIASTKTEIRNSKFYYIINLEIPLVKKPQKLVLEANVSVKDGKIIYTNTKLISGLMNLDINKVDFILNYLNPLDFSINIFGDKEANIKVKTVKIQNNTIFTDGVVIIPKD